MPIEKAIFIKRCGNMMNQFGFHVTKQISSYHRELSYDAPWGSIKDQNLSIIGGPGSELVENLTMVRGIERIEIFPYLVNIKFGAAFDQEHAAKYAAEVISAILWPGETDDVKITAEEPAPKKLEIPAIIMEDPVLSLADAVSIRCFGESAENQKEMAELLEDVRWRVSRIIAVRTQGGGQELRTILLKQRTI